MAEVLALNQTDSARRRSPFSASEIDRLAAWFRVEISDALAARNVIESVWLQALQNYEARAPTSFPTNPLESYTPIRIPLGAIHADDITSHLLDTLFSVDPLVTAAPVVKDDNNPDTPSEETENAKALQRLIDWAVTNEFSARTAAEDTIRDTVILGTGIYYAPHFERRIRRRTEKLAQFGARIFSIPPEDFIVPPGSGSDIQRLRWCAYRQLLNSNQLEEQALRHNWDTSTISKTGQVPTVTQQREFLSSQTTGQSRTGDLYHVLHVYADFDIDSDGYQETLYFVYDPNAHSILSADFSPYDRRPFEWCHFNRRAHMAYGQGVLEMLLPFEEEATMVHNHRVINTILVNTRMFASRPGTFDADTISIWSGRNLEVNDPEAFREIALTEVYPSDAQAEQISSALAQRRVGSSDLFPPRQSGSASPGSRTPVGTLSGLVAQTNKRLTPAFDAIRLALSAAVRQCLYRYQERLLANNTAFEEKLILLFGEVDASRIITLLRDEHFDENYTVELTALSATSNREAAKQQLLLTFQTLVTQYYERTFAMMAQIIQLEATNPAAAIELRSLATQIIRKLGEFMDRFMRTFREIRDPRDFLLQLDQAEDPLSETFANISAASEDLASRISTTALPPNQPAPTQQPIAAQQPSQPAEESTE